MSGSASSSYPDNLKISLPEAYLLAIGKVCVQWAALESIVDLALHKLMGLDFTDPRGAILTAHMTWPLKMDVLKSLVTSHRQNFPHLSSFDAVEPMLNRAQKGRNKIVHATWAYDNGVARILRATARGQLKTSMDPVSVKDIEITISDIGAAGAALLKVILNK